MWKAENTAFLLPTNLQPHRRSSVQRGAQGTKGRHGALAVPAERGQVPAGRAGDAPGEQQQGQQGDVRRCRGGAAGERMLQQPQRRSKALRVGQQAGHSLSWYLIAGVERQGGVMRASVWERPSGALLAARHIQAGPQRYADGRGQQAGRNRQCPSHGSP